LVLAVGCLQSKAQIFTETIKKEISFEKKSPDNALIVANINGNIKVEGYAGDKIIIEVTKEVKGKTAERLEKGKSELKLGIMDLADTIILYVDGICGNFGRKDRKNGHRFGSSNNWGYQWNDCCQNCKEGYSYKMDFTIRVPASVHLDVSTINDGDVSVDRVKGIVVANNVNGSIGLRDLERESMACTVNGDVDIEYTRNPQRDCRFYSLNGDINAWFQKGLAASMTFESFNGDFYTNINQLESLPVSVEKSSTGQGVKYKVNGNRYKIGSGGAMLDFETFNGNVYLKERTN
jgi:DUF4097 and DUF4098 domain-containing protein YvlB